MENKKYLFLEVGGRNCQVMTNDNICVLDGDCASCPHGKTLKEIEKDIKTAFTEKFSQYSDFMRADASIIIMIALKALLGGGGK